MINEFGVIDLAAKRLERERKREFQERYDYIKSCLRDNESFDSMIGKVEITDKAIYSLSDFIKAAESRGLDATELFETAFTIYEDAFHDATGINWWITIEDALVYYAYLKKNDETMYNAVIGKQ